MLREAGIGSRSDERQQPIGNNRRVESYVLVQAPSANRVYAQATPKLAAAELSLTMPAARDVRPSQLAGVPAVEFRAEPKGVERFVMPSTGLLLFRRVDELLAPVEVGDSDFFPDDLVTIPKYQGKTNEAFTRLLLTLTLSQSAGDGQLDVLDPMAGRGTTLLSAWQLGHNGYGVETEQRSVEALEAFIKTYLRRGRYKHDATNSPVRREGRSLGRRLDVNVRLPERKLAMTVFTGDTLDSAKLFGKKQFDIIVTDAPYGVVHGSTTHRPNPHKTANNRSGAPQSAKRSRSPEELLAAAIPVWATQLRPGGALGIAWNILGLPRERLVGILRASGLEARDEGPWRDFEHRVDSSIVRDLVVASKA